ncbi:MAG: hypothetical protein ACXWLH_03825 [Candidatus Saccharimonadales bacterium]
METTNETRKQSPLRKLVKWGGAVIAVAGIGAMSFGIARGVTESEKTLNAQLKMDDITYRVGSPNLKNVADAHPALARQYIRSEAVYEDHSSQQSEAAYLAFGGAGALALGSLVSLLADKGNNKAEPETTNYFLEPKITWVGYDFK